MTDGRRHLDFSDDLSADAAKPSPRRRTRVVLPRRSETADPVETERRRGRGTVSNRSGRFETRERVEDDDGWGSLGDLEAFKTTVAIERPKTVITRNESPDISFDRSINPYRGCEHGCVYCFARPSHAYLGLSSGLDFESRLTAKQGVAEKLTRELAAPGYKPRTIALGTNTDPYQPIERIYLTTRSILEVLAAVRHPVGIVTKSALVTRDIDILAPMAAEGLVKVAISLTTLDPKIARTMEPRATAPARRLEAIRQLSEAGIPVTVMTAPMIPAINDAELEHLLEEAHARGAREAGYVMLRLPLEVRDLFREWLLQHFPNRLRHVMSLVQSVRDGKDYDSAWGKRMTGSGPYATLIARRFDIACRRLGFPKQRAALRTDLFCPPSVSGQQLSLGL